MILPIHRNIRPPLLWLFDIWLDQDHITEANTWLMMQRAQHYQTMNFPYMLDEKAINVCRERHLVVVVEFGQEAQLLKSEACLL